MVNDGLPKNVLSFFVSQCLKQFPKPNIIVSYADPNNGHHGYIYQAINWLYTGESSAHDDTFINGQLLHQKTVFNQDNTNSIDVLKSMGLDVRLEKTQPKHRYFFFCGDKRQVKELRAQIKYPTEPYPKGDNRRYDSSFAPATNRPLF